jgi:hypothetical protein
MFKTLVLASLALAFALPADAGVTYTMTTSATGPNAKAMEQTAQGWVTASKMKVEFTSSGNPIMGKGSYLLTQDAGQTMLLVNPKEKTYARFDVDAMMSSVGGMLKAMGAMVKINISNPKVEKLLEEAGPEMLGLPTTHYKFRTSYAMEMKILMSKTSQSSVTEEEMWVTDSLADQAVMGAWLRKGPPKLGDEGFDKLVAAEMSKAAGMPLKRIATTTTKDDKGHTNTSTMTTEVTALDRNASVADSTFELPAGYKETQLMPAMPGAMGGGKE